MNDRARSCDRLRRLSATESVERFDPEMFAQREDRLFRQKCVTVVAERAVDFAKLRFLPIADENFRRSDARQFVKERLSIPRLRQPELARAQVCVREPEYAAIGTDRPEIICAFRFEQIEIAHRARANNLGDVARDDFTRLRFAGLIANRHASACLDELRDVSSRCVIWHAAHRNAVSFRQRHIEQPRRFLSILEKQFVKIAQPKKQQCVRRNTFPQPLILLHHRGQRVLHRMSMMQNSAGNEKNRIGKRGKQEIGCWTLTLSVGRFCHAQLVGIPGLEFVSFRNSSIYRGMSQFSIRLATLAAIEIINWHRARMFQEMGELPRELFGTFRAQSRDKLQRMLERGEYIGWLASPEDEPDRIVAGAGVQLREVPPHPLIKSNGEITVAVGRQAIVVNVFTEREWRRRGLAALLIKRIIDWSRQTNLDSLVLHASDEGRPLYERLGFIVTNEMRLGSVADR
jgi:GNAT superfamily N-acetyltransferase